MVSSSQRKVTDNDVNIATMVLGGCNHLPYAEAIRTVSAQTGYTVKTVYDMVYRAKNDPRVTQRLINLGVLREPDPPDLSAILGDARIEALERDAPQPVVPNGHYVKGVSSLVDEAGNVTAQWIKTDTEKASYLNALNAIIDSLSERVVPREPIAQSTLDTSSEFLALYVVADWHLGLYATAQDGGGTWNLALAVKTYKRVIDDLVARTPATSVALIANVGDFLHADNGTNRTPKSGAALDVDGRWFEAVVAAFDLIEYLIERVAAHHDEVDVIWLAGNHDLHTAQVVQAALIQRYKLDQRINVIPTPNGMYVYAWNEVALGFTHGDTLKAAQLPLLMAVKYPEIWAQTAFRVFHSGHFHHTRVQEFPGCIVEVHQAPTQRDAWHEGQGYAAQRSVKSIVYNANSEYSRAIVNLGA